MSEEIKPKKKHKVGKTILKILGILLLMIVIVIVVLAIRHRILSKRDRAFAADAYGEYYTTADGVKMNYTVIDNGMEDTAVILPGYGCATVRYEFDSFITELRDQFNFVLVEPLGYGLSDEAVTERSVDNYCKELHGLLASIDCTECTLIAHSIGGLYALNYCNQYPDEVQGFIGIDSSVPHQGDMDSFTSKPENVYKLYKIMRPLLYGSGINRLMRELSFEQTAAQIPTLKGADLEKAKALFFLEGINDTLMDEMRMLSANFKTCYDMKFPESVPVLYVIAKENCDMMPEWEGLHKDLVTNPESKVVVIEGAHYLHLTSLEKLAEEIRSWKAA